MTEELESRSALELEGLFRVPGNKTEIEKIKSDYDNGARNAALTCSLCSPLARWSGNYPNLGCARDDHAIAGVLKLCLRELPEPLLTCTCSAV